MSPKKKWSKRLRVRQAVIVPSRQPKAATHTGRRCHLLAKARKRAAEPRGTRAPHFSSPA